MMSIRHQAVVGLFALALLTAVGTTARAQPSTGYSGVVEGVITNSSGQPVAGAFVKLKNAERRLTFMVISQDQGRYTATKLPPGSYTVQGVGGDFQSKWSAPVTLAGQGPARLNISLTDTRAANLPAAWPRRLPEEQAASVSLPEGPGKKIIAEHCVSCHAQGQIAINRLTRAAWKTTIDDMRGNMKDSNLADLSDADADALLDYLAKNLTPLPPPDPNSRFPRTLMQGEARKYRVVEYDLVNAGAETHDIAVDPQGVGWANQRLGGKIGRLDPDTLAYSEISPPLITAKQARPGNLQISAQGVIWLPDPNDKRWLSYDIKSAKWTTWPFPSTVRGQPNGNSMALGADGTVWNSGPGSARRLNPVTKEWASWDSPTWKRTHKNPGGYGIAIAGDGRVWFAENLVDRMARVDPKSGAVDEFKIPVEGIAYPRRMAADPAGDIWVGLWQAGKLMKIDQHTGAMTIVDPPTPGSGAYSISFDKKRDLLWITLHRVDKIARYNPKTKEWVEFPLPQAETDVRRVEVDQNHPNRIWWSSVAYNARMGFVELLDSE